VPHNTPAPAAGPSSASSSRASASGRASASSSSSQIQSCPATKARVMPKAKPPAPPRLLPGRSSVTPSRLPGAAIAAPSPPLPPPLFVPLSTT